MAVCPFNIVELCAGAGAIGLGVEIGRQLTDPGSRTRGVAYVEREAFASANLVGQMAAGALDHAPVWSDLASFDARPWCGVVHCVTSGDPCQPNSVAGKRGGSGDDRFLIDQVVRIVSECRPDRLFRENVSGNADGQLAAIVPPLERLGYRVAAGIFSSAETGNSHRRERLFILAELADGNRDADGRPDRSGNIPDSTSEVESPAQGQIGQRGGAGFGDGGASLADAAHIVGRGQFKKRESQRRGRARFARASAELAIADGAVLEGRGAGLDAAGWQVEARHARHARLGGGGVESVAIPGPADARWGELLRDCPWLAPAIDAGAAERLFRRGFDAMADRVDRLRLLGNGVDPVAVAYAWIRLDALLKSARRAAAGPVR